MKIYVDFGYASGDGGRLAERLGFPRETMELEASTAREVFEQLKIRSAEAQEVFEFWFNVSGFLCGSWLVVLNRKTAFGKAIKTDADLDALLEEGDTISITSSAAGG